jgi:acyl carrier protein
VSQEIFDRFTQCAVKMLSVDAAKVTREARFKEDLEADSLDLVEFVMELESEFGVEVPEQELEGITTVGQAFDLIAAKTK